MFSPFSNNGGLTASRNALLEQAGLMLALSRNRQDIAGGMLNALDGGTMVQWFWDPNSAYPCSCAYVQNGILFIQVGGTNQELRGNFANVVGCLQTTRIGGVDALVNSWFRECADAVEARLLATLPAGWQAMPRRLIGHSQGAAVSFLLGVRFAAEIPSGPWDWFGFAAPRCFGGTPLPNELLPRAGFVIVNGQDPVPRLPPNRAIYSLRVSPASPLTWGTSTLWRHYGRILDLPGQGEFSYLDPGDDEAALTPSMLATVDYTHMAPFYAQAVQLLWRVHGG